MSGVGVGIGFKTDSAEIPPAPSPPKPGRCAPASLPSRDVAHKEWRIDPSWERWALLVCERFSQAGVLCRGGGASTRLGRVGPLYWGRYLRGAPKASPKSRRCGPRRGALRGGALVPVCRPSRAGANGDIMGALLPCGSGTEILATVHVHERSLKGAARCVLQTVLSRGMTNALVRARPAVRSRRRRSQVAAVSGASAGGSRSSSVSSCWLRGSRLCCIPR